jgi:hypothetical protein
MVGGVQLDRAQGGPAVDVAAIDDAGKHLAGGLQVVR